MSAVLLGIQLPLDVLLVERACFFHSLIVDSATILSFKPLKAFSCISLVTSTSPAHHHRITTMCEPKLVYYVLCRHYAYTPIPCSRACDPKIGPARHAPRPFWEPCENWTDHLRNPLNPVDDATMFCFDCRMKLLQRLQQLEAERAQEW